ncbi:unnamed protein product, partial [Effrenium voratum]
EDDTECTLGALRRVRKTRYNCIDLDEVKSRREKQANPAHVMNSWLDQSDAAPVPHLHLTPVVGYRKVPEGPRAANTCSPQTGTSQAKLQAALEPFWEDLKNPRAGSALLKHLARRKKLRYVLSLLKLLQEDPDCEVNGFHFTIAISACGKARKWRQALALFRGMETQAVQANTVTYGACISALKADQWLLCLEMLEEMPQRGVPRSPIAMSAGISALGERWELSLQLLGSMREEQISPDTVACNACISACASSAQWPMALHLLHAMPAAELAPDIISFSAAIGSCEEGQQWEKSLALFHDIQSRGMRLDDFSYNALIGSFSRAGEWQYALHFLSLKAASKYQLDVHACSACVSDSWRCSFFSMAPTF